MSSFKLRRKMYSLSTYKMKLSDLALEFGVQFPEDLKNLARIEGQLDVDLHYWAVSTPGIYMTAPAILIFNELQAKNNVIPVLVDNMGSVILNYNIKDGLYCYGTTLLKGEMPLLNTLLNQMNKSVGLINEKIASPDTDGGAVEVLKQDLMNYQMYRQLILQRFGVQEDEAGNLVPIE